MSVISQNWKLCKQVDGKREGTCLMLMFSNGARDWDNALMGSKFNRIFIIIWVDYLFKLCHIWLVYPLAQQS